MTNRILEVIVETRSLDPMSAELLIAVRPELVTATTDLRGRILGPTCPYSTTIEIAHPLLPTRTGLDVPGLLQRRVVVPEPSLWDLQSPFLYGGPIELLQDGAAVDRREVRHALRRIVIGPRGLHVNGRLVTLDGRRVGSIGESDVPALREEGCNLWHVESAAPPADLLELADRYGFLIASGPLEGPLRIVGMEIETIRTSDGIRLRRLGIDLGVIRIP